VKALRVAYVSVILYAFLLTCFPAVPRCHLRPQPPRCCVPGAASGRHRPATVVGTVAAIARPPPAGTASHSACGLTASPLHTATTDGARLPDSASSARATAALGTAAAAIATTQACDAWGHTASGLACTSQRNVTRDLPKAPCQPRLSHMRAEHHDGSKTFLTLLPNVQPLPALNNARSATNSLGACTHKTPGPGKRHRETTSARHVGNAVAQSPAVRRVWCRAPRLRRRRTAVPAAATVATTAAATSAAPPPMQRHSRCGGGG